MQQQINKRKRRSDRSHVIYGIRCLVTNELYVGLTVCAGMSIQKALQYRWKRHVTRAYNQGKRWKLCEAIRKYGEHEFVIDMIEKVRGKAEAHQRERELTKLLGATLNTV
jgi:hypothetical protein